MKQIELLHARGLRILIDGQEPTGKWGYGGGIDEGEDPARITLCNQCGTRQPLQIGPHSLVAIKTDIPIEEAYFDPKGDHIPTTITLEHADGTTTTAKVKKALTGSDEKAKCRKLTNGKYYKIDEITLYLYAEV